MGGLRGLLTEAQVRVLRLRAEGLTQEQAAERLGSTRQNVSLLERRARRNIRLAEETLRAYREVQAVASVTVPPGTHLVDVPRLILDEADRAGVKVTADFQLVYKEIRQQAGGSLRGVRSVEPIRLLVLRDGSVAVA